MLPRHWRRRAERVIESALFLCAAGSVLVTAGIIAVLVVETVAFLREVPITEFLFGTVWTPAFLHKEFGVLPLLMESTEHLEELWERTIETARAAGVIKTGDLVALIAGTAVNLSGSTNVIKVDTA